MTPTTTIIEPPDQLDPWGLGVTAADRSVVIAWQEPLDEPVDEADLLELTGLAAEADTLAAVPAVPMAALPAVATVTSEAIALPRVSLHDEAPPRPQPVRAEARSDSALLRLPFPPDRLGVMALFGAVIVAQAFYIGFSLTGEASARPAGVSPRPPVIAPAPVAHVALPVAPVVVRPATGMLRIDSGAVRATVSVDGVAAGTTPVVMAGLSEGTHHVRLTFGADAVERAVELAAGETVALVVDAPAPRASVPTAPAIGWLHITAPFAVQVFEDGQLVSDAPGERLTLPAGGHVLELVNTQFGFRATTKAVVLAGKVSSVALDVPEVPVAVNAQPWAEVVVDGRPRGETPMANLMLPVGVHQIVLRHPDLGARTETLTVRATGANRVAADLRR